MSGEASARWFENQSKEDVIRQISELRKNIKRKHRALKRDIVEGEELLEKTFKPISDPLKKLVEETAIANEEFIEDIENKRKRKLVDSSMIEDAEELIPAKRKIPEPPRGVKRKRKINLRHKANYDSDSDSEEGLNIENQINKKIATPVPVENVEMEDVLDPITTTPQPSTSVTTMEIYESQPTGEEFIRTPEGRNLTRQYIEQNFTGQLAKEYFSKLISGNKAIDHNYGVTVSGNDWKIGNKILELDHDDLIIGGHRYEGRRGLYELIFMNYPDEYVYDEQDLNNYAKIIFDTNVHRVNFSPRGKVRSNRGRKYKHIISNIILHGPPEDPMDTYADRVLQSNPSGSGVRLTEGKPNIVYYDDPNEIINRLRILLGSQEAGHTGHENEINAIIEELKELESELLPQLLLKK
jgi:hypothetical protein